MAGNVLVTPPNDRLISIEEFRQWGKIDHQQEEHTIETLLDHVSEMVEGITGRKIITQTWRLDLDFFPREIVLPFAPVSEVTSITYYDENDTQQTLSTSVYEADLSKLLPCIRPTEGNCWPTTYCKYNTVSVTYQAGYANAEAVPSRMKIAAQGMALRMHDERKLDIDLQPFEAILGPLTIKSFVE